MPVVGIRSVGYLQSGWGLYPFLEGLFNCTTGFAPFRSQILNHRRCYPDFQIFRSTNPRADRFLSGASSQVLEGDRLGQRHSWTRDRRRGVMVVAYDRSFWVSCPKMIIVMLRADQAMNMIHIPAIMILVSLRTISNPGPPPSRATPNPPCPRSQQRPTKKRGIGLLNVDAATAGSPLRAANAGAPKPRRHVDPPRTRR